MVQIKTIILTGATGFLGSHLLEAMLARDYTVIVIKRSTSNTKRIDHLLERIKCINADKQSIEDAFAHGPIDTVVHVACEYGRGGVPARTVVETNILFSLHLLEMAVDFKVPSFINTDSFFNASGAVQRYMNCYTLTKRHFVDWLHVFCDRIRVVNLRLQHVYGPNDSESKFVTWLLNQMLMDISLIPLTSGVQQRDFIYVDDVVSVYLYLIESSCKDPFVQYDVGTGKLNTVRAFVETMRSELEMQIGKKIKPILGFGEVPCKGDELNVATVDIRELMSIGWKPKFSLAEGLNKTISSALLNAQK